MEHFLISIIPSENISIKIRAIRAILFRQFGIISSRSLPEMIPVAFINKSINKELFKEITQPNDINSTNYKLSDSNDIFLEVNAYDLINSIRKKILKYESSGIISLIPGFYLGTVEKELQTKRVMDFIESQKEEKLIWKKNSLELIRVEINNELWWNSIFWETIWAQKIKIS
jgi:hypothetical protein